MASSGELDLDLDKDVTKHRFQGRVFVVTGGTSGIGLGTVERLCNDGGKVAVFDIDNEAGKQLETRLQAEGYEVRFYSVDVSSEEQCERGVQEVVRDFGDVIHGLVNNAGIQKIADRVEDITIDFDRIMGVNLKSSVYMVKLCLPYMKKGKNCAVVNVASVLATRALGLGAWAYHASKGGILNMTRAMSLDLGVYGIRANSVSPGAIWTNMQLQTYGERSCLEPRLASFSVMRRCGESEEVAAAIAFMLSKDASFITGANLDVDGGTNAMCPPLLDEK